ncbi:hypothetical protein M422DRAFT_256234 [Sphaerobolus stellatus SS14]|uniref:Uncharacterized protein n=1 Tax=Sphaerobolus stellatus (strain SS14) TaxID=990650 RepID=A0A0C9VR61_SPHS4|nr:hypothetical protein M422DRAFT_256234 [Sphaerobolus stellatus SS14]
MLICSHVQNSQHCTYQHKDFGILKIHFKNDHKYNSQINTDITLWPDPPAPDVMDGGSDTEMVVDNDVDMLEATHTHTAKSPSPNHGAILPAGFSAPQRTVGTQSGCLIPPSIPSYLPELVYNDILNRYGLRILMPFKCIICVICEHALTPFGLTAHLKSEHEDLSALPSDLDKLNRLWVDFDVVKDLKEIPAITGKQPALPGLKIIPGYSCQHCTYSAPCIDLMKTMCVPPPIAPPGYPWEMYPEQHISKITKESTVYLAPTLNEVLPLQKDARWHLFLADVIISLRKVNEYLEWIGLPLQNALEG